MYLFYNTLEHPKFNLYHNISPVIHKGLSKGVPNSISLLWIKLEVWSEVSWNYKD